MERKKFKKYWYAITIAIGVLIGFSAIQGQPALAIGIVVIGMILLYLLRSRVTQILEDERIYKVSEKASRRTIQVVGITTATLGLSILGLSKGGYLDLTETGYSLAYFATYLLIIYMTFYTYYNRKLGA